MSARRIVLLPGDGIGPEVTAGARRVLEIVAADIGLAVELETATVGGAAIDTCGEPLPAESLALCKSADAVFLGAVGGPQWQAAPVGRRPEDGLLRLRAELEVYANLRPIRVLAPLLGDAPVTADRLRGTDLMIVRELTGGIYFGPRQEAGDGDRAFDTMAYSVAEVERVAHVAFRLARRRRRRVASVDKANVLASMRLWRRTVNDVATGYRDVAVEHVLVDACAMRLIAEPTAYDVLLAPNLFGDILSDEASVLAGSLGMLPSASLGVGGPGLFEPVHGSAPDIAGRGLANPIGAILSIAMLLRESLDLGESARRIEGAVQRALEDGYRTADLAPRSGQALSTEAMVDAVVARL